MGLEALVVTHLPNICVTSRTSSAPSAVLLFTREAVHFITDFRYLSAYPPCRRSAACPGLELWPVEQSYEETLVEIAGDSAPSARIGFEAAHLTVSRLRWFEARCAAGHG